MAEHSARNAPGRPAGKSMQVLSRQAREWAKETGALPHEIMLDMARGNPQKVRKVTGRDERTGLLLTEDTWVTVDVQMQMDAAKAAAPYYAPRISAMEVTKGMTDDDLDRVIAQFAAEAGVAGLLGGEGATEPAADAGAAGGKEEARARPAGRVRVRA